MSGVHQLFRLFSACLPQPGACLCPAKPPTAPPPCSAHSLASDVVRSFVTSYLATRPQTATPSQSASQPASSPASIPASLTSGSGGASSSGGGSSSLELRTDARLWEVQWEELTLLRLVGHGSFGSVYLAEWNQTRVAVKVLVGRGERQGWGCGKACACCQEWCQPASTCSQLSSETRWEQPTLPSDAVPTIADDINRGRLELPERVLRELQAEAAVMSRMRHPK